MLYSMTGYGAAEGKIKELSYRIDLRSLNSKGLDLNIKLPEQLKSYESQVRNQLKVLVRGKIDLQISVNDTAGSLAHGNLNLPLLNKYYQQLLLFSNENGIEIKNLTSALLRLPGILDDSVQEIDENVVKSFLQLQIGEAIAHLNGYRQSEGESIFNDLKEKLLSIRKNLSDIPQYESERVLKIRERFEEQLRSLEKDYSVDSGRLETELIFYIEKLDINEEKVRLSTHLDYFEEIISDRSQIEKGKKLNFIAQEMLREVNTIGSKANHAEIQKLVVLMKDNIEKIKEQTNNTL